MRDYTADDILDLHDTDILRHAEWCLREAQRLTQMAFSDLQYEASGHPDTTALGNAAGLLAQERAQVGKRLDGMTSHSRDILATARQGTRNPHRKHYETRVWRAKED